MNDPIECPDCGLPWPNVHVPCAGCGLRWEDVAAAADFLTDLEGIAPST